MIMGDLPIVLLIQGTAGIVFSREARELLLFVFFKDIFSTIKNTIK